MDLPHALVEGLTLLSDALDDPFTDLEAVLAVLTDDLTGAVPLYLGLTITLHVEDCPVIISTLDTSDIPIRASLLLSLLPTPDFASTGSVVFYSGVAGSFTDLADDARWIFNLDGYPVLDSHLAPFGRAHPARVHGLSAFSDINQALGVLVEDGLSPDDARTELRRRAHSAGRGLSETARHLLSTLAGPGIPTHTEQESAARPTQGSGGLENVLAQRDRHCL